MGMAHKNLPAPYLYLFVPRASRPMYVSGPRATRAGSPGSLGLAALGPEMCTGRDASVTEMYLRLPALSYRLVPRAFSLLVPVHGAGRL